MPHPPSSRLASPSLLASHFPQNTQSCMCLGLIMCQYESRPWGYSDKQDRTRPFRQGVYVGSRGPVKDNKYRNQEVNESHWSGNKRWETKENISMRRRRGGLVVDVTSEQNLYGNSRNGKCKGTEVGGKLAHSRAHKAARFGWSRVIRKMDAWNRTAVGRTLKWPPWFLTENDSFHCIPLYSFLVCDGWESQKKGCVAFFFFFCTSNYT